MEDLTQIFDEKLKISALSKSKQINNDIKYVTLGPNAKFLSDNTSNYKTNEEIAEKKNLNKNNKQPAVQTQNLKPWDEKRLFVESEKLRKEEVTKAINNRIQLFKEKENRILNSRKYAIQESQKSICERISTQENNLQQELNCIELRAKAESARLQEFQKLQEQKRSETAQKIQNKHFEKEKRNFEIIKSDFIHCYKNILENCKKYDCLRNILQENSKNIEKFYQRMKELEFKYTTEDIDGSTPEEALSLLKSIKEIEYLISVRLKKYAEELKENEKKIAAQNEIKKKAAQPAPIPVKPPPTVTNKEVIEIKNINKETPPPQSENQNKKPHADFTLKEYVSLKSYNTYKNLEQFLRNHEQSYRNLLNDEKYKKYRFDCQKAINMPINAITAVNGAHLTDKFNRLSKLLSGQTVEVGNTYVSVTQHPEALAYCTDLLAKKFVHQGDLMVSSNPKSAFAFAAVIVALWTKYADFGKLVLAHFYRECIYLVPMYPPQIEGQTNEQYYKSLGYRYGDEGIEEQNKFLKRMSGIIRLYTAILVTKQNRMFANMPNPHGIRYGWRLICCILNLEPRIDITATAIFNVLDVAGNTMLATYGKQFNKIIKFIYKDYLPRIEKIDSGGPVVRLQVFLNNILKNGGIPQPEGILPNNFW